MKRSLLEHTAGAHCWNNSLVSVCRVFASFVLGDVHVLRHSTGTQEWCRCFSTSIMAPRKSHGNLLLLPCSPLEMEHQAIPSWMPLLPSVYVCDTQILPSFHQTPPENTSFVTNTFIPCSTVHFNQTIRRYFASEVYQCYAIKDLMMLPPYQRAVSITRSAILKFYSTWLCRLNALLSCHMLNSWKWCCAQVMKSGSMICLTRAVKSPKLELLNLDSLYSQWREIHAGREWVDWPAWTSTLEYDKLHLKDARWL